MLQLLQPSWKNKRKKPARQVRAGMLAMAAVCAAALVGMLFQPARAIVIPSPAPPRRAEPTATPTGTPNSTILPLSSSLFFVLDDTISSHSKAGTVARAHLRDAIILSGVTVAKQGTPVSIVVTQSTAAQSGNVNGSLQMYFEGLPIASGKTLPLVTPSAHVDPNSTAGQQSTRAVTDTVGDIFIPGHFLYHMLRKGADVTLRPGTVIRARTAATVHVANGVVAVSTPAPFSSSLDTPHPGFVPAPLATPPGFHTPVPKPSPSKTP